jgi:hypothetical protein
MSILIEVLKQILKAVLVSLVTEKFIKEVIVYALEKLVAKTDNEVDDELVSMVKKALQPAQPEQPK